MNRQVLSAILVTFLLSLFAAVPGNCAAREGSRPKADLYAAGATFPAPLYQRWIREFSATRPGFSIFYEAVGSGEGAKRFLAGEVDIGASDSALSDEQIASSPHGTQLIPATAGIIVLAYNLPELNSQLRLSREVYVDIFLGKIRRWNDPRISSLNPKLRLPELNIVTVVRSDSSGTTWNFTNHLNAISGSWRAASLGVSNKMDWPGVSMAAPYNEGVATRIRNARGAIGYVEYGVARRAGLTMAALENKAGAYVAPTDTSGTVTLAANAKAMPANLRLFLPDPDGDQSYPITTYSWLLLPKQYAAPGKAEQVRRFVGWCLTQGQHFSTEYGYAPLPQPVASAALKALETVR